MDKDIFDIKDLKGKMVKGQKGTFFAIIALALIIGVIALNPFVTVGAGERGVVLRFGAVQGVVLEEGLHFVLPFVNQVVKMDVKVQKAETHAAASSSDLQEVSSTLVINFHIMPDKANFVYQHIGLSFKDRIIDPAVQEVVKAVTATYTAEQLITKRPEVSSKMKQQLNDRLIKHNIFVDEFSIVNFSFSKVFMEAIESKQTAEQLALKAERDLSRIKIEAEQKIASAKAEAESLRLQKENISPLLLRLRQIEAAMAAIEKWNGVLPKVTSGAVPFIDVSSYDEKEKK
jgi:regulator of protease activity HflC (stomatin/prohibitin superfamily)